MRNNEATSSNGIEILDQVYNQGFPQDKMLRIAQEREAKPAPNRDPPRD